MGLFGNKKVEEPSKKKEVVEEKEEEEMEDTVSCDDCGEDFKESMINEDGLCKVCAKRKKKL